nr:HU family DNA-binding protein [Mycoplasmopsis synoviae]
MVNSKIRSAKVDLPWSIWAIIEKVLILFFCIFSNLLYYILYLIYRHKKLFYSFIFGKDCIIFAALYSISILINRRLMTKTEFIKAVSDKTGLTVGELNRVFDGFVYVLQEQLVAGEKVQLSNLGIFDVATRTERTIKNHFTGKEQVVAAKKVVKYKPSKYLTDVVNE